jgi:hypothetical protein
MPSLTPVLGVVTPVSGVAGVERKTAMSKKLKHSHVGDLPTVTGLERA